MAVNHDYVDLRSFGTSELEDALEFEADAFAILEVKNYSDESMPHAGDSFQSQGVALRQSRPSSAAWIKANDCSGKCIFWRQIEATRADSAYRRR